MQHRMHWLRKACAILAAVGTATVLAACGGGAASGPGSLTVFLPAQPNFPTEFAAWSKDLSAAFKAKTGADLVVETYSSAAEETTKIQSSIVSGTGPDIYNLGTTFTPVAYGTGGFLELSDADWAKIGGRERYLPETLGMSGPEQSKQIGIPIAMRPFSVVYNTEMFAKAGITAAAHDVGRVRRGRREAHRPRRRCVRNGDVLRRRVRPVEVRLGDDRSAGRLLHQ